MIRNFMRNVFLCVYYSSFTLHEFSTKHKISITFKYGDNCEYTKQMRTTDSGCSSSRGLRGGKSLVQTQSLPYYVQLRTLASKVLLRIQ